MSKPAKSTYSTGLYQVSGITGSADATVFEINVGHGVFNGENIFKIGEINYGDVDLKDKIEEIIIIDSYIEGAGRHTGIEIFENVFSSFPKLKKITYTGNKNSGTTKIDGCVFSGDQPLEEVDFAEMNATTLPSQLFAGLSTLNSVKLPNSLESISEQLFCESSIQTITIPETVKYIYDSAFAQSNLITLIINSTEITTYGDPFKGIRHQIETIKIPYLKIIPKEFFYDMNISNIELSDACTEIGPGAFFQCTKLTSINLKNVTAIKNSAFTYCVGLNEVIGLENVQELGFEAFTCVPLKNTTCLDFKSIETIGYGCFFYCGVKKVIFGSDLSSLGEGVFLSSDVEEVDLSKCVNLTGLSFCMFDSCYKLTSVKLSESIKRIGARAFYGCSKLNTSCFNWSNFSVIGMDAFTGTEVYSNESNWKDGILYVNGCILESKLDSAKTSLTASDIQARVIADGALANYTSLTSISIDDSTESIGNSSFFNNYKVLSLSYAGTKEEWSKILLGHKWNYNIPAFTVNCIDDNVVIRNPESHHLWYSTTDGKQVALANDAYTQEWYDEVKLGDVDLSNGSRNWLSTNSETSLFVGQTLKSVILPADISGINLYVFKDNKYLLSINLENIGEVKNNAFYGCESLKEVLLPNNTSIGENAFDGCTGLKNLTVNNLSIFDDTVFQNTGLTTRNTEAIIKLLYPGKTGFFDTKEFFRANSSLYETGITADRIIIGSDNIERTQLILDKEGTVADYAFAYCTNLTSIKFGDEITTIGKSVFDNCTSLESIHFGKNCSIGKKPDSDYWSISFIPTLKSITVDQGNKTLQILKDAGVTFLIKLDPNPNIKTVMAVCLGNSEYAKLPYYRIASNIFKGCGNLKTLILESSLIEESAFSNCSSLSRVSFDTSLRSIGDNAFKDCTSLGYISYSGTPDQWNAIPKGTDWNHNVPATYVQCNGGQQVLL